MRNIPHGEKTDLTAAVKLHAAGDIHHSGPRFVGENGAWKHLVFRNVTIPADCFNSPVQVVRK